MVETGIAIKASHLLARVAMSLLWKIADTIGGSIDVSLEEQTIQDTDPSEPHIELRANEEPIENRDDASSTMAEKNTKSYAVEEM